MEVLDALHHGNLGGPPPRAGGGTGSLASAEKWRAPAIGPGTIAFLQYTSGSTAMPKGVIVTHANLLYNERSLWERFEHTERSLIVSWLPLYHDMGLIGNALQSVFAGIACVLMSPAHFLENPMRWLQAITRYRATTSGGPNFAFDLCVEKIPPEAVCNSILKPFDLERFVSMIRDCLEGEHPTDPSQPAQS